MPTSLSSKFRIVGLSLAFLLAPLVSAQIEEIPAPEEIRSPSEVAAPVEQSIVEDEVDGDEGSFAVGVPTRELAIVGVSLVTVDSEASETVIDELNALLVARGGTAVVTRAGVESRLGQIGLERYSKCHESACLHEAGTVLGVDLVAAGWTSGEGDRREIRFVVVDVRTGQTLGEVAASASGGITGSALRGIANELGALAGGEARVTASEAPDAAGAVASGAIQYATLVVASVPVRGDLYIDGKLAGPTPCRLDSVVPRRYTFEVRARGYKPFKRVFDVKPGARKRITVRFDSGCPSVTVLTTPAGAAVTLDREALGPSPVTRTRVRMGMHRISLGLEGYAPVSRTVQVTGYGCDTLRFALMTTAVADSLRNAKARRGRIAGRVIFGMATAGFWTAGLLKNAEVSDALDQENAAWEGYSAAGLTQSQYDRYWNEYTSATKKADLKKKDRNALYVVGAVFAAGFGVTFLF